MVDRLCIVQFASGFGVFDIADNAYDPDVHASLLRIDVEHVKVGTEDVTCVTFTDNGAGMTPEKLHNMLRYGVLN